MVFWKKKEKDVVDLGVLYERQKKKLAEIKEDLQESSGASNFIAYPASSSPSSSVSTDIGAMGFLGNLAGAGTANSTTESSSEYSSYGSNESPSTIDSLSEEKRKRLAKRLMNITAKLEDLSNQIYHLQQRMELVEKKLGGY